MSCSICLKDLFSSDTITLPCSCSHCQECLATWTVSKIQEPSFHSLQTVICMSSECKKHFSPEGILNQFSSQHRNIVSDALTSSYITNAPDIRRCPKGGCDFAGIINLKNPCRDALECDTCGFQWRDPTSLSRIEKISARLKDWDLVSNEFLSSAWEEIKTRSCDKCGVNIEKNGGCPHMTCKKCNYEFCWYCGMQWKGHDHKICTIVVAGKVFVFGFPIFHILGLLRLLPYIWIFIYWLFYLLFQGAILNGSFLLMSNFYSKTKHLDSNKGIWAIGIAVTIFLVYVYYFELWYVMIWIIAVEAVFFTGLFASEKFLRVWFKNTF